MTYYLVGGSAYVDTTDYFLGTFMDAGGNSAEWGTKDFVRGDIEDDDPFWSLGLDTGVTPITRGNKQIEIGLFDNYRIKITTSGIFGWVGPGDNDFSPIGGGGATTLDDLDDVVITGTPADNELLSWDNGSSRWINQTPAEAGLAVSGHNHAHNDLTGLNDGVEYEHITQTQKNLLHSIYTLEVHNNDYHNPDYKIDFSENTAFNKNFGTLGTEVCVGNDSRLSDSRTPIAHVLATTGPHSGSLPLTDIASWVQGSIIKGGSSDWEALSLGTENYVLKAGASEPAWGQVAWGEVTGKPTEFTPISHNNTYHSINYHTEADGTGVVTVHSDVTDVGSGAIITTGERNALHTIVVAGDLNHNDLANLNDGDAYEHITQTQKNALHTAVTEVYNLRALDDRDFKPNTTSTYKFIKAYFTSLGGMTGVADSDYQDLLILNTYTDGTGGDINALTFDKSEKLIKHWLADQTAGTWGTPKTLAYTDALHTEDHDNAHHTTNYHSESDGTGVVTIHSDVSDSGSGSIITLVERGKIHDKQHVITSTTDHTSTATSGQILKADANGLPIDATNTDTEVASAVTLKHNEAHVLATTGPHTGDLPITDIATGTAGYRLRAGTPNTWAETVSNLDYDGALWTQTDVAPSKKAVRDVIDPLTSSLKYSGAWTVGIDKYPEAQTDGTVGSTVGTSIFTDTTKNFTSLGVLIGDILNIREGVDEGFYVIDVVGTTTVTCTGDTFGTVSNLEYQIFRAVGGEYWICDAGGEYDLIWYEVGDWLIWNDTEIQWDRIRNSFGDNLIYVSTSGSIQNAIDKLESIGGGKIVLAPGSHTVSTELTINNVDVELFIEGSGVNTTLVLGATNNGFNITNCKFLSLRNFEIDITAFTSIDVGIIVNETNNNKIEIYGINIIGDNVLNGYGIELKSHNVKIDNCYIYKTNVGISLAFSDSSSINTIISNNNIVECYICVNTSGGGYGSYTKVIANNFTDYTYRGVMLTDTIYTIISNNHFKTVNTAADAIYAIVPPDWNLIIGNVIDGGNYAVVAGYSAVISNNIITNMSRCDVIHLYPNSTCSNNVIYNCDENSTLTIGVITIGGDYSVCNGNTIYNCSNAGSGVCHPILIGSGCDYNIIGPNVFHNNENNTVNDSGIGTKIFGDAIHYNVANEITAITLKTTPVDADELIIEDSEASYIKKSITIGSIPSGSLKGQLQGHIVPLVGCAYGTSGIAMNDSGDSAMCVFDLTENVDSSEDIKIVLVYASNWDYQCAINVYMGFMKTNSSEPLAWNYKNNESTWLLTGSADFGLRLYTWTIPAAIFDTNDTVTIYWNNNNNYDYYAHSMYLLYTEAT